MTARSKILIVDDEAHIRLLYRTELEAAGYEVALSGWTASGAMPTSAASSASRTFRRCTPTRMPWK